MVNNHGADICTLYLQVSLKINISVIRDSLILMYIVQDVFKVELFYFTALIWLCFALYKKGILSNACDMFL